MQRCESALDSNLRCQLSPRHFGNHAYFDEPHNQVVKWGKLGDGKGVWYELIKGLKIPTKRP